MRAGPGGDHLTWQALQTLLPFLRAHWRGFVAPILGVVAVSGIALLRPWPLKVLIDDVLHVGQASERPDVSLPVIAAVAGAIVGIAAVQGLFGYVKDFFLSAASQRVAFGLRRALFEHAQRLPLAFHERQRTGEMMTRVTTDVTKLQEVVADKLVVDGFTSVLQFGGMLAVMLFIDWKLALVALAWAPLMVLTSTYFRRRIKAEEQRVRDREGNVASVAQETMSSIRVVKAFAREREATARFEQHAGEMVEASVRVARLEARFAWMTTIQTAAGLALIVFVGAYRVAAGAITAGMLVVFIQYMRDLQTPLNTLARLWARLARAGVRAERILEILHERPAVEDRPGALRAPRLRGDVRFEGVSFGYSPDRLVLEDIDLEIEPGETAAVVGPTGAGKSTLASLLLRLYDPMQGTIRVDGRDIREYRLDSYLEQIAVVLQESLLFQTTLRENIAYGKPDATFPEICRAAAVAYCFDFVDALPDGFETVVGERGGTLSGGQRQRIAIARALIRDAPILVLDEPTTGLDASAEKLVLRAIEPLRSGRTTLMIAHKLATVRGADRIYVVEKGRIVESGTHRELARAGGLYARMHELQTADRALPAVGRRP